MVRGGKKGLGRNDKQKCSALLTGEERMGENSLLFLDIITIQISINGNEGKIIGNGQKTYHGSTRIQLKFI